MHHISLPISSKESLKEVLHQLKHLTSGNVTFSAVYEGSLFYGHSGLGTAGCLYESVLNYPNTELTISYEDESVLNAVSATILGTLGLTGSVGWFAVSSQGF